jgi:hypothetical protein
MEGLTGHISTHPPTFSPLRGGGTLISGSSDFWQEGGGGGQAGEEHLVHVQAVHLVWSQLRLGVPGQCQNGFAADMAGML